MCVFSGVFFNYVYFLNTLKIAKCLVPGFFFFELMSSRRWKVYFTILDFVIFIHGGSWYHFQPSGRGSPVSID